MARFEGKVAFITGMARGQGKSHALRLASEGADIIGCDICEQIEAIPYELASERELEETAAEIEALGRRVVALPGDVRDPARMKEVVAAGLERLGRLDVVVANAGVAAMILDEPDPTAIFLETLAINLAGVRHSVHAAIEPMVAQGEGGSIVIISSTQGLKGVGGSGSGGQDGYTASKHGVVGLMRTWANWLAPDNIRVNAIHPTGVKTYMIENPTFVEYIENKSPEVGFAMSNLLDVDAIEVEDVTAAVAWLASDEARYITGVSLPVDAGHAVR